MPDDLRLVRRPKQSPSSEKLEALAGALAQTAHREEAVHVVAELQSREREGKAWPDEVAGAYLAIGDRERAIATAARSANWKTGALNADPEFDALRSDPRFIAILQRAGL